MACNQSLYSLVHVWFVFGGVSHKYSAVHNYEQVYSYMIQYEYLMQDSYSLHRCIFQMDPNSVLADYIHHLKLHRNWLSTVY